MTTEPTPKATTDDLPDSAPPVAPVPGTPARGVRTGTVIWGLVLAACGAGVIVAATGRHFDLSLAATVVLGAAGLALLVGSLVGAGRRR